MNLSKVVKMLTQAEDELMKQVGLNERDYDTLEQLMNIAHQISDVAFELVDYIDEDDEGEDWYKKEAVNENLNTDEWMK